MKEKRKEEAMKQLLELLKKINEDKELADKFLRRFG